MSRKYAFFVLKKGYINTNLCQERFIRFLNYHGLAIKAKEHHRVEKSAPHLKPHEVHEVSSFDHFSKFPIFQSFPALSGAFQLHHLPPVPPGN